MKAYQAVAHVLRDLEVDVMFGLLGDGNLRFAIAARELGVEYVAARHESAAVAMADAYSRVTGRVGIATVTTGPGVTNTVTALGESIRSRTPLLLLAGAAPTHAEDHPQLIDQDGMLRTLGIGVQRVRTGRRLATDVATGFRRAEAERRPVVISVPTDIQDEEVGEPTPSAPSARSRPAPPPETVRRIVESVRGARRPVVLAGWGAELSGARGELIELSRRLDAVVTTTAVARGFFVGVRSSVGVSGGFASEAAADILGTADLVLAFGAQLNRWTTRGGAMFGEAEVIQVDTDEASFEHFLRGVVPVVSDAREAARALLDALGEHAPSGFASSIPDSVFESARHGDAFEDASTSETIDPRTLTVWLRESLPDNAVVVSDSGAFLGFPGSYYEPRRAGGYLFCQGFQTMGLALGQAVGVAKGRADSLPVVLIGDGGLLMNLGELATLAGLGTPVLVVVYNDSAYGAEVHIGAHLGLDTDIVRFPETDFAAVARSVGGAGHTVRTIEDLEVLDRWLEDPSGLMLIDCKTDAAIASPFLAEVFRPVADAPRAGTLRM